MLVVVPHHPNVEFFVPAGRDELEVHVPGGSLSPSTVVTYAVDPNLFALERATREVFLDGTVGVVIPRRRERRSRVVMMPPSVRRVLAVF